MINSILKTEKRSIEHAPIDLLEHDEAFKIMLSHHNDAIQAVNLELKTIKKISLEIIKHLKNYNGRIIYAGAGTSIRIGVQDGVELLPTFGWPKKQVSFLIAGGEKALTNAIENAEDNIAQALRDSKKMQFNSADIVIGIAASGSTPYTLAVIKEAVINKALTIGISNNRGTELLSIPKFKICLDTGPEVVVGSTRLKAATSQKICLNLISTFVMTRLGKVKNGLMIKMKPTNSKLKNRFDRINRLNT
jgi:N-acetylmuramic acid 6-phosphate etherase